MKNMAYIRPGCLLVAALAFLSIMIGAAAAQKQQPSAGSPPPEKVRQLIELVDDPEIRAWLQTRSEPEAAATGDPSAVDRIVYWETIIRGRFAALFAAVPRIGDELANASAIVTDRVNSGRRGTVIGIVILLIGLGYGVEWLFRRTTFGMRGQRSRIGVAQDREGALVRIVAETASLFVFALASIGLFLAFEWPPLLRQIVLTYLLAFIVYRVLTTLGGLFLAADVEAGRTADDGSARLMALSEIEARFWLRRLKFFTGYFMFGWATVNLMPLLAFSVDVTRLAAYLLGLGLLAMAIEIVWRHPGIGTRASGARAWLLTAYLVVLWLLWVGEMTGLLWLGIYALLLPKIIAGVGRAAQTLVSRRGSRTLAATLLNVLIVRGARALVIAAAVAWLAFVLRIGSTALAIGVSAERIMEGLLHGIVILLLADLLWQLSKAYIAYKLELAETKDGASSDEMARRARLRTLLPIFRNSLAVFIGVVAVLTVLSGLGVQIAPLIAGAGIFGVAIGFGSQTLVKDVLSGVFFMLDDAFRVGEYIQSGSYKGTVESFSLRSVRLRHHRGPVFTVPFGDLGAVQNMSRDWVIDKFMIRVPFDTDIQKVKKLVKTVGAELLADPELAPEILETVKMKGVEEIGDFGIQLSFAFMARPGHQSVVRRRAYTGIRAAFMANGIEFAQPTVQVGSDDKHAVAAAATASARSRAPTVVALAE